MNSETYTQHPVAQEAIAATVGSATLKVMLAGNELSIEPQETLIVAKQSTSILLEAICDGGVIEEPVDSKLVIVAIKKVADAKILNNIKGAKE